MLLRLCILDALPDDDLLAFSTTCRTFKATVEQHNVFAAGTPQVRVVKVPTSLHIVGSVALVCWAQENGWKLTCPKAARGGVLEVLQLTRAQGCEWDLHPFYASNMTSACAAEGGHLAVLQWARSEGCPWNEETCAFAAESGHLAVLQWARAEGCPEA